MNYPISSSRSRTKIIVEIERPGLHIVLIIIHLLRHLVRVRYL